MPPNEDHYTITGILPAPELLALKPVRLIWRDLYPGRLPSCFQCNSEGIILKPLNACAIKTVFNIFDVEYAVGEQWTCKTCQKKNESGKAPGRSASYTTSAPAYWQSWDINRGGGQKKMYFDRPSTCFSNLPLCSYFSTNPHLQ